MTAGPESPAGDRIRLVRDRFTDVEAIRARFAGHAYDLHRHDEWLVGVTEAGVQDFFCRGRRQRSTPGRVILIEPGELHDGQAGDAQGFSYAMLYLPIPWVAANLDGAPGSGSAGTRTTLVDDAALVRAIRRACAALAWPGERLARDAALDAVLDGLRPHLRALSRPRELAVGAGVARRARDALCDLLAEEVGADDLARLAGAPDRFHLARAFRAAYGTSPHAFLVQARLMRARTLLRRGEAPAAVAADCGFADQSHLGRWFRRAYGITPAAFRAAGRTAVPDGRGLACP